MKGREKKKKMWKLKAKVISVIIAVLGAVAAKLEKWFQQVPGTNQDLYPEDRTIRNNQGIAQISKASGRGPEVENNNQ